MSEGVRQAMSYAPQKNHLTINAGRINLPLMNAHTIENTTGAGATAAQIGIVYQHGDGEFVIYKSCSCMEGAFNCADALNSLVGGVPRFFPAVLSRGMEAPTYGRNFYTRAEILWARKYWQNLTGSELVAFWRGDSAKVSAMGSEPQTFWDWLVGEAREGAYCTAHDI